jgi:N-acetylmuramoyl-L-alanine amidase
MQGYPQHKRRGPRAAITVALACLAATTAPAWAVEGAPPASPAEAAPGSPPGPTSSSYSKSHVAGPRPAVSVHQKGAAIEASSAILSGDGKSTAFFLDLSAGVRAEVFTLANPYRVIVDLPDVSFHMAQGTGRDGRGLVSTFRYGLLAEGKARVVLDTTGPVLISKAEMTKRDGQSVRLAIELAPTSEQTFGSGTGGQRTARAPLKPQIFEAPVSKPKDRVKPVILIDAGHGGIDPGATSPNALAEKSVVLAVARTLKAQLAASGRYDVHMTRTTDVFVPLDQRLKMSRDLAADLFISLHADSIAQGAETVRGATVYTLSERASDEAARLMAEKENASDAVAGLETADYEEQGEVRSILIDLLKRETANFSADFSNTLVKRLGGTIQLSGDAQRSAAFKVLRQADTPSVLVELGYMSHPEDEKLLNSAVWQRRVAAAITSAVDSYFAKRTAGAR